MRKYIVTIWHYAIAKFYSQIHHQTAKMQIDGSGVAPNANELPPPLFVDASRF